MALLGTQAYQHAIHKNITIKIANKNPNEKPTEVTGVWLEYRKSIVGTPPVYQIHVFDAKPQPGGLQPYAKGQIRYTSETCENILDCLKNLDAKLSTNGQLTQQQKQPDHVIPVPKVIKTMDLTSGAVLPETKLPVTTPGVETPPVVPPPRPKM